MGEGNKSSFLQRDLINRCNLAESNAKYFAAILCESKFADFALQCRPDMVTMEKLKSYTTDEITSSMSLLDCCLVLCTEKG